MFEIAIDMCNTLIFVLCRQAVDREITFLYAHGNAEDLEHLEPLVEWISRDLDVSVCAFEYPVSTLM